MVGDPSKATHVLFSPADARDEATFASLRKMRREQIEEGRLTSLFVTEVWLERCVESKSSIGAETNRSLYLAHLQQDL